MFSCRLEVYEYMKEKYGASPEFMWARFPDYAVFRHGDNRKWFGLIMNVSKRKLGDFPDEPTDILNLKLSDPLAVDFFTQQQGIFRGYHISRGNWISVLLDGSVPMETICDLIAESYTVTASAQKKRKTRPPKEWLIPANPKYYDIAHAFDDAKEILWKQGAGVKKGDTVFVYAGAPISAILFRCKVTETDIPYEYHDKAVSMKAVMKIRLERKYPPTRFTFDVLKNEFGIYAVRGPRGVTNSLSAALKGR